MKLHFLLIPLILLLGSVGATAGTQGESNFTQVQQAVDAQFNSFFYSSEINSRFCGNNIDKFIVLLGRKNILPADFKRVVIRIERSNWHMESMLIATGSRFGLAVAPGVNRDFWYFHVVGMWKGRIYDFSFQKTPTILPTQKYLSEMFVPKHTFQPFGLSYRIRGNGPNYEAKDAQNELNAYTFEVAAVDRNAHQKLEAKYPNLNEFIRAYGGSFLGR